MSKLYPPDIGGVIPSFYGEYINIPIIHNKLNSVNNVQGYSLIIKSVNNNKLQDLITVNKNDKSADVEESKYNKDLYYCWDGGLPVAAGEDYDSNKIYYEKSTPLKDTIQFTWPISNEKIRPNTYYKIQVAYINSEGVGYYSDVATVRYTSIPGLDIAIDNNDFKLIGTYSNTDPIERVYEYCFDIYKNQGDTEPYESSGWLLHNSNKDTDGTFSIDTYTYKKALEYNSEYYCIYKVKTINGMNCKSEFLSSLIPLEGETSLGTFGVTRNIDEGRIVLSLRTNEELTDIVIKRYCSKDKYLEGIILYTSKTNPGKWYDYSFEHGYNYRYELYAKKEDGKLYKHNRQTSSISSSFEDMFLSDGERQLKIRFNPKVASFKKTILETKTDTIGGQFPFFFRNGNVGYHEFSISGLISYNMDEARLFMDKKNLFLSNIDDSERESTPAAEELAAAGTQMATDLTDANLLSERIFKVEVLDWLTNGKPKLFRSPTEGNFIVRLMNVSLSPNDTLGRMLHTFSATAYEVAEYTPENLRDYNVFFEGRH